MSTPFDQLRDLIGLGPRDYSERLKSSIVFVSPGGSSFTGFFQKPDTQTNERKVGQFSYPGVNGRTAQDRGSIGDGFTIPFGIAGKDHDLESTRLFRLMGQEKGIWFIDHPVEGPLNLQLLSFSKTHNPVNEGGITRFATEWFEPIDPQTLKTPRELQGAVKAQKTNAAIVAARQFVENVETATAVLQENIKDATELIDDLADEFLAPVAAVNDAIFDSWQAVQVGIQDTTTSTVFRPMVIAGQIQQLHLLPLLSSNDINARFRSYKNLADRQLEYFETQADLSSIARNYTFEVATGALFLSMTEILTTGELTTRRQAVDYSNAIFDLFWQITDTLDAAQEASFENRIDRRYFSQSLAFAEFYKLLGLVQRYLLTVSYDLKIEKRFVLDRDRAPIEIAFNEYDGTGEADFNYDFFIESNQLADGDLDDILVLKAGREVVLYV